MDKTLLDWVGRLSLHHPAKELPIFSKWLHRFKNAHRREKCFQKLVRIEKDFKRYYQLRIFMYINTTVKQLTQSCDASKVLLLLEKLLEYILFNGRYLEFMESTFYDLIQKMEIGHLIPMYIVITASLSRLWYYMRIHLWALVETYRHLTAQVPNNEELMQKLLHDIDMKYHKYFPVNMRELSNKEYNEVNSLVLNSNSEVYHLKDTDQKLIDQRLMDFKKPPISFLKPIPPQHRLSRIENSTKRRHFQHYPNVLKIITRSRAGRKRVFSIRSRRVLKGLQRLYTNGLQPFHFKIISTRKRFGGCLVKHLKVRLRYMPACRMQRQSVLRTCRMQRQSVLRTCRIERASRQNVDPRHQWLFVKRKNDISPDNHMINSNCHTAPSIDDIFNIIL